MNLFQKIIELRKTVDSLVKDKEGHGYNYVTGNQILSKVKDRMNELELLLIPSITDSEPYNNHPYRTAQGKDKIDLIVQGTMSFTWVDGAKPEDKFTVPWAYYGQQDDVSKAFGSALTYSERYFWLKLLGIPTDEDDPDSKDTRGSSPQGTTTYEDAKKVFASTAKRSGKPISEAQQKRLWAMAGKDRDIVDELLAKYNVEDEGQITMGEMYDSICQEAQEMYAAKAVN